MWWPTSWGSALLFPSLLRWMPTPPELLPLAVLPDPDDLAFDPGIRRGGATGSPDTLRVVSRLLRASDLAESEPELFDRRVPPVPESAPDVADDAVRVQDERVREEGAVQLVSHLEQIELVGDPPLLVREKREIGADARAEGSVDVGLVDGRHGDAPILPLELVLGADEVAEPDLLLRAPPAAHEREHERLLSRDHLKRKLLACVLRQADVRELVPDHEVVSHRLPPLARASRGERYPPALADEGLVEEKEVQEDDERRDHARCARGQARIHERTHQIAPAREDHQRDERERDPEGEDDL